MPTSDAQKKATIKYMSDKLDDIKFRVPKGQKELIKAFAENKGKSLQSYIIE